jgi:hypothetical protein
MRLDRLLLDGMCPVFLLMLMFHDRNTEQQEIARKLDKRSIAPSKKRFETVKLG